MSRLTKRISVVNEEAIVYTKGEYTNTTAGEMRSSDVREVMRKLAEYEDLEEQGLLLKLPCKLGDTVYIIKNHDKKIVEDRVIDYDIYSIKEGLHLRLKVENNNDYIIGKFNNDIFLTIEEAEEKLKIMLGE